ncbi:MAG: NAD(P)H-dependent oxidoreductase [Promethearchaeota archaeon]
MNVLVILAHPDPKSFNHAIAKTCRNGIQQNGHSVTFHDLYKERFNPLLLAGEIPKGVLLNTTIQSHCHELQACDGIVIIHPNWWGQPPAILKGWIDRVLRPGVAYEFKEGDAGEGVPEGLLKGKTALIFNTSNTSTGRETDVFKDPLDTIWKNCIFGLCGVERVHRKTFSIVVSSSPEQRAGWMREVEGLVGECFPKGIPSRNYK